MAVRGDGDLEEKVIGPKVFRGRDGMDLVRFVILRFDSSIRDFPWDIVQSLTTSTTSAAFMVEGRPAAILAVDEIFRDGEQQFHRFAMYFV